MQKKSKGLFRITIKGAEKNSLVFFEGLFENADWTFDERLGWIWLLATGSTKKKLYKKLTPPGKKIPKVLG